MKSGDVRRLRLVADDVLRVEFAADLFERSAKRGIVKISIVNTSCRGGRDLQLVIFHFVCASFKQPDCWRRHVEKRMPQMIFRRRANISRGKPWNFERLDSRSFGSQVRRRAARTYRVNRNIRVLRIAARPGRVSRCCLYLVIRQR